MFRLSVLMTTALMMFIASSSSTQAQILTCSDAGSGECHFVHYHVQSYNDATRNLVELYGINRFATTEACEAERARRMNVEKQLVDYVLKLAPRARVKESNFGSCHCDMTSDPASRYYLDDQSRFERMHLQRSIAFQLLEEAFDKGLATDDPLALGLSSPPTSWVASLWPAVADVPPESPDRFLAVQAPPPMKTGISAVQNSQLDTTRYQLVEIAFNSPIPLETVTIGDEGSAVDHAADFINTEIADVQAHMPAVWDMEEGSSKELLLELIQQRFQLLSNLSRLVQTSGPSSLLASGIAEAQDDRGRRELIGRIFGAVVAEHWSPEEPAEMLIDLPDSVATDPVAVLRDSGNRFSRDQKQLALYEFLMRTGSLTENQEIWLSGIIESYLKGDAE